MDDQKSLPSEPKMSSVQVLVSPPNTAYLCVLHDVKEFCTEWKACADRYKQRVVEIRIKRQELVISKLLLTGNYSKLAYNVIRAVI